MKKILLQAGHQNTTTGATGAPEEQSNNIRIRDRLSQVLISKGFQLFLADANHSSSEHFDLALAIHCDANYAGDEGGGFVACADPSVDSVWTESDRIRDCITQMYFPNSGIRQVQSRENPNTLYYYWWYNLSLDTPCVLIEMGESVDPHDRVILADTDRVANAIARGICLAFNIQFDVSAPTPTPLPPPITPTPPPPTPPPPTPPSTPPPTVPTSPERVKLNEINKIASKPHFFYRTDWNKIIDLSK